MSLLTNSVTNYNSPSENFLMDQQETNIQKDELTLKVKSSISHPSSMSEVQKAKKRNESDSLEKLFQETIQSKGEGNPARIKRTASNELEIEGLSGMALHSFMLKAEQLGKNITYMKTLKIKIND